MKCLVCGTNSPDSASQCGHCGAHLYPPTDAARAKTSESLRRFALPYEDDIQPPNTLGYTGLVIGMSVFALFVLNHITLGLSVLWFLPLSLVGAVVSLIAMVRSIRAGWKNNAASLGLGTSLSPYFFSIMIPLYEMVFHFIAKALFS